MHFLFLPVSLHHNTILLKHHNNSPTSHHTDMWIHREPLQFEMNEQVKYRAGGLSMHTKGISM